jgi:hypothetical protein
MVLSELMPEVWLQGLSTTTRTQVHVLNRSLSFASSHPSQSETELHVQMI